MRGILILGVLLLAGVSGFSLPKLSNKDKKSFETGTETGAAPATGTTFGKGKGKGRGRGKAKGTGREHWWPPTTENIDALENFCNFKKNGDYPSPYDGCQGYINCHNYHAQYYTCPDGMLYNAKARHCDKATFVDCPAGILDCDVGIVGGGISGLYMAYELLKDVPDTSVCIFEKESEVGGRIRDHRFKEAPNIDVGLGAWRIDERQLIMRGLLDELLISSDDWTLVLPDLHKMRGIQGDTSEAIKDGYPALQAHPIFGSMSPNDLWTYLIKPENAEKTKNYATLFTYISNTISPEGAHYLLDLAFHRSEIEEMVSPTHFVEFVRGETKLSGKYLRPRGGMSAIIDALRHEVDAMGGNIYTNTEVKSITKEDGVYILLTPNLRVRADKLVVATPPGPFRKIKGRIARKIQRTPQFDSILPIPAFKGGAVYKTPWWEDVKIGETTVKAGQQFVSHDNCLGASLPYRGYGTNGEGVLHTIYTDGRCAKTWNDIAQLNKESIDVEVHRALETKYGIKIPKPIDTEYQFWDPAWHFQKSGTPFTLVDISNWAKRPFPRQEIFMVGEAYNPHRAWCQGAIISARHALNEGWGIRRRVLEKSHDGGLKFTNRKTGPL